MARYRLLTVLTVLAVATVVVAASVTSMSLASTSRDAGVWRAPATARSAAAQGAVTSSGPASGPASGQPTNPPPTGAASPKASSAAPGADGARSHHGPGDSAVLTGSSGVALTFDDGPDPVYTPQMLNLLKRYGVKATFCLIGSRARDYPGLVRRIVADGHSLCNHSWQHLLDLAKRPDGYIRGDLQRTNQAILAAVPGAQIKYFRAPGGFFTPRLSAIAGELGMKPIYWFVDPQDWNFTKYGTGGQMVSHIVSTVRGYTRPGAIVLSHDRAKPDTITAYENLLPWLVARFKLIALPT
jgi:peptidoglycan/xylan/chitin deacetylase (PgdA/CDA1 family)